ncbi:hypothetical protein PFISCL1PPCAC_16061, partial [Pristionchus fissidentatus]
RKKEVFMEHMKDGPDAEILRILKYIDSLSFYSVPDYDGLHRLLRAIAERNDCREWEALDWSSKQYEGPEWSKEKYKKIVERPTADGKKDKSHTDSTDNDDSKNDTNSKEAKKDKADKPHKDEISITGDGGGKKILKEEETQGYKKPKKRDPPSLRKEEKVELKQSDKRKPKSAIHPPKKMHSAQGPVVRVKDSKKGDKGDKEPAGGKGSVKRKK